MHICWHFGVHRCNIWRHQLIFMDLTYNPIALVFISYGIGAMLTELLIKKFQISWFDNHNYINDKLTKSLGVLAFGWLIRNSFMGWFNQKLKLKPKSSIDELKTLKQEMGYAEVGHLIAFYFLLILNVLFIYWGMDWYYIVFFFFVNIVFNLYLVFLQQYNKRRLDRVIDSAN